MKHLLVLIIATLLWSCGSEEYKQPEITGPQQTIDAPPPPKPEEVKTIIVLDKQGKILGHVSSKKSGLELQIGDKVIVPKSKSDKRVYAGQNGQTNYVVKQKPDAFKLYDGSEKLLLKVKIKDSKIELADNAEMTGSSDFKKYEKKMKWKREDEELASLKWDSGKKSATIITSDGPLNLDAPNMSYGMMALFMEEIPREARFILMAELLDRGL
jgi:hypothetical protein